MENLQGEGHPVGVHADAPVQVAPSQAVNEQLGGGHVSGQGDGVLVTQAGDIHDAVVHVGVLGVVEEQDHVDLIVDDALADLLDAAVLVGQEQVDRQAGGLRHHTPRGIGGADGVLGQDPAVGGAELDHQLLFAVVAHKGDVHGGYLLISCWRISGCA